MRKRIFFICGSMNQTTQMHQISKHLADYELSFSPFYCHGFDEILRRLGLVEFTIAGNKMVGRCRKYCTNDFPYNHYVLACTSNLREVFRREDRPAFIRRAWFDDALQAAAPDWLRFDAGMNQTISSMGQ